MMDQIKANIIITTYNHEKYVKEALDSFLMQKTNFEYRIVIHDDCSTDNTVAIIKEYEKKYPDRLIVIYRDENRYQKGLMCIDETVLSQIKGKYCFMCDGDDYWTDDRKLQKQVDFLEEHPDYSMCVHQTMWHDMSTNEDHLLSPLDSDTDLGIEDVVLKWGLFHTSSMAMRAEVYMEAYRNGNRKLGNFDYYISCLAATRGKIRFMNENMSYYRYLSCDHSWSSAIKADNSGWSRLKESEIRMLDHVDEMSGRKYHDTFARAAAKRKFLIKGGDFEKGFLKDKYMMEIFSTLSPVEKTAQLVRVYTPHLHKLVKKITKR